MQVAADLAEEHAAIIATLREDLHSVPASPLIDRTAVAPEPPPLVIPGPASVLSVYRWARRNRYFQLAGPDGVGMGGGGSFSFWLDGDLCSGENPCECVYCWRGKYFYRLGVELQARADCAERTFLRASLPRVIDLPPFVLSFGHSDAVRHYPCDGQLQLPCACWHR